MKKKAFDLFVGLAALVLSGCCTTPEPEAVARERGLFKVTTPRYRKSVAEDPTLDDKSKQAFYDYLDQFDSWLQDRENRAGSGK